MCYIFAFPTFCHLVTLILMHKLLGFVIHAGEGWSINVTRHIYATLGSDVIIQCSFTFPSHLNPDNVKVYWRKPKEEEFVFHANDSKVLERYRGKTKLIGNKYQRNCSLMIQNIGEEDLQIYLRISVNGSQYSFKEHIVNITLSGEDFSDVSVYRMHVWLITKVHTFPNPADKSQIEVLPPFLSEKYEHYYYFSFTLTQNCIAVCYRIPSPAHIYSVHRGKS